MTRFVQSILGKRNPRNVPLDLFNQGEPPPFPDWWKGREGLTPEELEARDRQTEQWAQRQNATHQDRRVAARQEYAAILSEIVRSIGESLYRLESSGLIGSPLGPSDWRKLGERLGPLCRDVIAALFTIRVLDHDLYFPGQSEKFAVGKKSQTYFEAPQLRDAFEERAILIERWITARVAFETREETLGWRALKGSADKTKAVQALQNARNLVTHTQADIHSGTIAAKSPTRYRGLKFAPTSKVAADLRKILDATADIVSVLNDPELSTVLRDFPKTPLRSLQASVKKVENLAKKGEPFSRKLAREAAIREGDEPKQNPFIRDILRYA